MKRLLKNRVRLGLGFLMALAVLLVLQLIFIPLPAEMPSAPTLAGAYAASDAEVPLPVAGPGVWRQAAVGLGLTLLVGSMGLWWYLERRLFIPLEDMTGVVAAMSEGHLDQTLEADAGTELDHLAESINTFSVNQQEGLLFAWNQAGSSLQCLKKLEKHAEKASSAVADHQDTEMAAIIAEIQHTRDYLEGIQALVRTYYLYDVCLEDRKALAAEDAK